MHKITLMAFSAMNNAHQNVAYYVLLWDEPFYVNSTNIKEVFFQYLETNTMDWSTNSGHMWWVVYVSLI